MKRIILIFGLLLWTASSYAVSCNATTKLFTSATAGATSGTHTLVTASGTENTSTTVQTAKLTNTWFRFQSGVAVTSSTAGNMQPPYPSAGQVGWNNDAATMTTGCLIPSGTWTVSSSMSDSSGTQTGAFLQAYFYLKTTNPGSTTGCPTSTSIDCQFKIFCNVLAGVSMSISATTRTASGTCPAVYITSGDQIYFDVWYKSGSTNSSSSTLATTAFRVLGTNDFVTFPQAVDPATQNPVQPVLLQRTPYNLTAATCTTCTFTVASTTASSTLILLIQNSSSSGFTVNSISDGGDSFSQVSAAHVADTTGQLDQYLVASGAGGKTSVTITLNSAATIWGALIELTGMVSSPLDIANTATGTGTPATDTLTGVNGIYPDLWVSQCQTAASGGCEPASNQGDIVYGFVGTSRFGTAQMNVFAASTGATAITYSTLVTPTYDENIAAYKVLATVPPCGTLVLLGAGCK